MTRVEDAVTGQGHRQREPELSLYEAHRPLPT